MRVYDYKIKSREEIETMRIINETRLAIGEALMHGLAALQERAKKITKRETDKLAAELQAKCKLGEISVSFNNAYSWYEMDVTLSANESERKKMAHPFWNLKIFNITYGYNSEPNGAWTPKYYERDISNVIKCAASFLVDYPQIIADYKKIEGIIKHRTEMIEEAIEKADNSIPNHIMKVIESYSN